MTFKSFEFYFVHVLPSDETHPSLGWKPVHFSVSVVIETKILVSNSIERKNIILTLLFCCFFKHFYTLYVSDLQLNYISSSWIKRAFNSFIFILAHVYEPKGSAYLPKFCNIPNGFCLGL